MRIFVNKPYIDRKMIGLLYSSLAVFIIYVGSICLMYGIPPSISESFYLLRGGYKGLKKDMSSAFTIFCFFICFGIVPSWIQVTPDNYQVIPFASAAALGFVGAAPLFKTIQRKIHFVSAILCMILAILWIFLITDFWYVPMIYLLLLSPKIAFDRNRFMFWLEIWAFLSLFTSLLLVVQSKSHLF